MEHQPTLKSFMTKTPWKTFQEGNQSFRIQADYGLQYFGGNSDAYFSVTGSVDRVRFGRWVEDSGGCIHDEVLKHFPELKPLVDLHLSDTQGAPMHAEGNAWFWFREFMDGQTWAHTFAHRPWWAKNKQPDPKALEHFVSHCRITHEQVDALISQVKDALCNVSHYSRVYEGGAVPVAEKIVKEFVSAQRPRWLAEAQAAIKQFNLHD